MPFQVCLFDDGIQTVPLKWINGEICVFPTYTNQIRVNKAISMEEEPQPHWKEHEILRRFGNPTEFYSEAVEKGKVAEKSSDVDMSDEGGKKKRKDRAAKKLYDSDEEPPSSRPVPSKKLPVLPQPPKSIEGTASSNSSSEKKKRSSTPPRRSPKKTLESPRKTLSSPRKTLPSPRMALASPRKTLASPMEKKNSNKDFEFQVLRKLNGIIFRLKSIESRLDQLEENKGVEAETEDTMNLDFPLKSQNELETFEKGCLDPQFSKKCITHLKSLGGSNALEATLRVLRKVLTNELADKYSLLGRKKKSFKNLAICKIVFDTVKHHVTSVTEKEVDAIIARWLVQAKGRMSRMEKKTGGNEPSIGVEDEEGEI